MSRGFRSPKVFSYIFYAAIALAVVLWLTIFQNSSADPVTTEARISYLNVGQGDSALINLPGSVQVLIDGGRDSKAATALPKEMPKFDKKIEYVMFSHPDADHIGGLSEIFDSFEIGEVIEGVATSDTATYARLEKKIEDKKIKKVVAAAHERIDFEGGGSAQILWPKKEVSGLSLNDQSLVLNFDYKGARAIFLGDCEVECQNGIAREFTAEQLKAQVLKVSHHGSTNGLNKKFLDLVKPTDAVVSVGKNSYGHPNKEVLAALYGLGMKVYRTDEIGTVNFGFSGGSWQKTK